MNFIKLNEDILSSIALLERECFTNPWSVNSLREELTNPYARFFAAQENGETLGYIGAHNILGEVYVTNVAVFKSHRRKGIAKALINELIKDSWGAEFITLEVRKSNEPAIKLYESLGFAMVGERKNFYENPKEDALLMTLYLDGVK